MKIPTERFAELLTAATTWDEQFPQLRHAQREYLLTNFVFGDDWCVLIGFEKKGEIDERRK